MHARFIRTAALAQGMSSEDLASVLPEAVERARQYCPKENVACGRGRGRPPGSLPAQISGSSRPDAALAVSGEAALDPANYYKGVALWAFYVPATVANKAKRGLSKQLQDMIRLTRNKMDRNVAKQREKAPPVPIAHPLTSASLFEATPVASAVSAVIERGGDDEPITIVTQVRGQTVTVSVQPTPGDGNRSGSAVVSEVGAAGRFSQHFSPKQKFIDSTGEAPIPGGVYSTGGDKIAILTSEGLAQVKITSLARALMRRGFSGPGAKVDMAGAVPVRRGMCTTLRVLSSQATTATTLIVFSNGGLVSCPVFYGPGLSGYIIMLPRITVNAKLREIGVTMRATFSDSPIDLAGYNLALPHLIPHAIAERHIQDGLVALPEEVHGVIAKTLEMGDQPFRDAIPDDVLTRVTGGASIKQFPELAKRHARNLKRTAAAALDRDPDQALKLLARAADVAGDVSASDVREAMRKRKKRRVGEAAAAAAAVAAPTAAVAAPTAAVAAPTS